MATGFCDAVVGIWAPWIRTPSCRDLGTLDQDTHELPQVEDGVTEAVLARNVLDQVGCCRVLDDPDDLLVGAALPRVHPPAWVTDSTRIGVGLISGEGQYRQDVNQSRVERKHVAILNWVGSCVVNRAEIS